jgi:hypothetical protein
VKKIISIQRFSRRKKKGESPGGSPFFLRRPTEQKLLSGTFRQEDAYTGEK